MGLISSRCCRSYVVLSEERLLRFLHHETDVLSWISVLKGLEPETLTRAVHSTLYKVSDHGMTLGFFLLPFF